MVKKLACLLIIVFVFGVLVLIYPYRIKSFEIRVVNSLPKEIDNFIKIDVNKADISELQKLEGVGKTLAERIVKYREENGRFNNLDDLLRIKGIGEKTFKRIKGKIKISKNI
jgi:competence ComEA-like helix-hairpin-helix protein